MRSARDAFGAAPAIGCCLSRLSFGWGAMQWAAVAHRRAGARRGDAVPVPTSQPRGAGYASGDAVDEAARFLADRPISPPPGAGEWWPSTAGLTTMRLCRVPDMRTGGAERHWATLLPLLRERGAEAGVLCLSEEGALFGDLVRAGVPARCVHLRGRADARGLRAALASARPRPDVVVSRGVNGLVVAAAIARKAHAPHVVNEHTPLQADGELLAPHRHQRLITRALAPRVDAVIAVARRQVDPLVDWGYRRERIRVIPNGIQPVERASTRRGCRRDGFAVLCVARSRPRSARALRERDVRCRRSEPRLRASLRRRLPAALHRALARRAA